MRQNAFALLGALLASAAPAASFDCEKAVTRTEQLICANADLSNLDDELARSFKAVLQNSDDKQALVQQQSSWLKQERDACQSVDCLKGVIQSRVAALSRNSSQPAPPSRIFYEVLPKLRVGTHVPLLLPSAFPPPIRESDIHHVAIEASQNKYSVIMYYEEGYGDAGYFGRISGEKDGRLGFKGQQVSLANGITGYFRARKCGGSCSPTWIAWFQGKLYYTLELKLPLNKPEDEEEVMAAVANSMIRGGVR
jgi:uncharacterized protein